MTDLDPRLLKELGRLAQRYPPEQWSLLARLLEDEEARRRVGSILREMTEASRSAPRRTAPSRRGSTRARSLQQSIEKIAREDPERAAILDGMWVRLRAREVLPTMASVRAFVEAAGLSELKSSRREQAVTEVVEQLSLLPKGDLETVASTPTTEGRHLGDEYERWVRLILDRKTGEAREQ